MRKVANANAELSAEKLAELKWNAANILANRRRELMNHYPFVAAIAMNLELVPVRDSRMNTACTDGKSIFFDIDFLSTLSKEEQLFVFGHEVWHNVMMHFLRGEGKDKKMFNIATDIEVNQILVKDGFTLPKSACTWQKFCLPPNLSAEEYYDLLMKNKANGQKSSNGNDGSGQPGSQSGKNPGLNGKDGDGQFDENVYKGEDAEEREDARQSDKYGKLGHDDDFKPGQPSENVAEKIREAVVSAVQMIERERGEVPGHIASIVEKLVESEVPWQEVLASFVTKCLGDKRQWNPPNRRHVWHDAYLQSRRGEKLRVAVGIDVSGSTNPDMMKFISELNSLLETFGNYEAHVIQCDTRVQDYQVFDDANPMNFEENGFKLHGGGGTILTPIFDFIKENEIEVDATVVFTDGYCEKFDENNTPAGSNLLWVISSGGTKDYVKAGEIVQLKSND